MGGGGVKHKGVAVRRGFGHGVGADGALGTRAVFNDHRLLEIARDLVTYQSARG